MIPKPILVTDPLIVKRADLCFCHCPVCANELNWRHTDMSFGLYAHCCCHVFKAFPANDKMNMYRIEPKPLDMTNVHWLWYDKDKKPRKKAPPETMRFA